MFQTTNELYILPLIWIHRKICFDMGVSIVMVVPQKAGWFLLSKIHL